jgi:hypothetical protein
MGGACSKQGNNKKYIQNAGKPKRKRPLGRPGHRIKMDLNNRVGGCGLDSSGSGLEPMVGSCEHENEPSGSIKGGKSLD